MKIGFTITLYDRSDCYIMHRSSIIKLHKLAMIQFKCEVYRIECFPKRWNNEKSWVEKLIYFEISYK